MSTPRRSSPPLRSPEQRPGDPDMSDVSDEDVERWSGAAGWSTAPELTSMQTLLWRAERHPVQSSTSTVVIDLDRAPDWDRFVAATEWGTRLVRRLRQRVVPGRPERLDDGHPDPVLQRLPRQPRTPDRVQRQGRRRSPPRRRPPPRRTVVSRAARDGTSRG